MGPLAIILATFFRGDSARNHKETLDTGEKSLFPHDHHEYNKWEFSKRK